MNFTLEELKEQIHYDPITGIFTRISKPKGSRAVLGVIKGSRKKEGHLKTCVFGKEIYLAILAWFYMTGTWPTKIVDHKNGISDDNRWENLRELTRTENTQNQVRAHKSGSTGLLGAHYIRAKNKYHSSIWNNGTKINLGYFNTAEEAHNAYVNKKREIHISCTI